MIRLLFLLLFSGAAVADDFRPLFVELNELEGFRYTVRVKLPPQIPVTNHPTIEFPDFCRVQPGTDNIHICNQDLGGATLLIAYPGYGVPNSAVVKMSFLTGEEHTITLSSGVHSWRIPMREEVTTVAVQYTWLGMEHIWIGFDHLLFVLCLIWIAGSLRRILITITGFTLAHSVTLALSALQIVVLPVPPIEAVIALSVLFLATEIARGERGFNGAKGANGASGSLTWRYPIAVSSTFGLLHGLGFAAVLNEIGLPQTELVTGLVFFNVGVEIGQVVFALIVVLLLGVLQPWTWFSLHGQTAVSYFVGCVAAYWFIERSANFLS